MAFSLCRSGVAPECGVSVEELILNFQFLVELPSSLRVLGKARPCLRDPGV